MIYKNRKSRGLNFSTNSDYAQESIGQKNIHFMSIINSNRRFLKNSILNAMKFAVENEIVLIGEVATLKSVVPLDQSICFQVFELKNSNANGKIITINAESNFSISKIAARAKEKLEKNTADKRSFEHLIYILIELNQFVRLLGAAVVMSFCSKILLKVLAMNREIKRSDTRN